MAVDRLPIPRNRLTKRRSLVARGSATARQTIETFGPADGTGVVTTKLRYKVTLVRGARCFASRGC